MAEEIKTTKTVIITLDASGFIKNTRAAKGEAELLNKQLELVESTLEQFQKIAAKSDDQRLVGAFNRLAQSASFLKTAINEAGDADALKALNPQIDVLARRFASFEVQLQRVSQAMADRSVIDILVKEFEKLIDVVKTVISTVNDAPKSFINFVNSIVGALDTFNLFTKNLGFIEKGVRALADYMDANGGHIMDTLIQGFKEGRLTDIVREVFGDLTTIAKKFFDGFLPPGALDATYEFWARWGNIILDSVDSTFGKVKSYIGTAFDFIVDAFKGETFVDKVKNTFSEVGNVIKQFATNETGSVGFGLKFDYNTLEYFKHQVGEAIGYVQALFKKFDAEAIGENLLSGLKNIFELVGVTGINAFNIFFNTVTNGFDTLPSDLKGFAFTFISNLKLIGEKGAEVLIKAFKISPKNITNPFEQVIESIKKFAKNETGSIGLGLDFDEKKTFGGFESAFKKSTEYIYDQWIDVTKKINRNELAENPFDKYKAMAKDTASAVKEYFKDTQGSIFNWTNDNTIWENLKFNAKSAALSIQEFFSRINFERLGTNLFMVLVETFASIIATADNALDVIIKTFTNGFSSLPDNLKEFSDKFIKNFGYIGELVSDAFSSSFKSSSKKKFDDAFAELLKQYAHGEGGSFFNWTDDRTPWENLKSNAKAAALSIKEFFSDSDWFKNTIEKAKTGLSTLWEYIKSGFSSANEFIGNAIGNKDWFNDVITKAKDTLTSFITWVKGVFSTINNFILSTLGNKDWMVNFLNNAKDGFASFFASVRSVFENVRLFITEVFSGNFIKNIKETFNQVTDTIKFAFETVFPTIKNATQEFNNFITNSKSLSGVVDIIGQMVERFGALGLVFKLVAIAIIDQIQAINDKAIQFFKDLGEGARNSVKAFITLQASIEAGLGAGQVEEFSKTIKEVGQQFALTSDDVTKATQSIVLFGNEIGLTADQMQQLINASAVYARSAGKDVASTAQSLVQALSGNIKGLREYNIVIKDATLQQQGFLKAGQKFSDLDAASQKVLVFNKIIAGVPTATKIAEAALNSTAGAADRLAVTLKEVENQIGIGALQFTNSSAVAGILNTILENLNDNFLQFVGYIGAVSTKVLGMVLSFTKWFLILGAIQGTLVSISKLLQSTNWFVKLAFDTNIPLVGQSLRELITRLTGGQVVIKTFGDSLSVTIQVLKNMGAQLSAAIFKVNIFKMSFLDASKTIIVSFVSAMTKAIEVTYEFTVALLRNPIVAAIVGITAVFYGLYKALTFIEEQTGVFSTLWDALTVSLSAASGPLEIVKNAFMDFYNFLKDTFFTFLGVLVAKLAIFIKWIFRLASILPGLSDNTKKAFADAAKTLDDFGEKLKKNDFNVSKMGPSPEQLKQQEESTKRLAALAAKAAAAVKDFQDKTIKARLAMVDIGTTAEKLKLEEAFKKGEISYGRFIASIEQADLGGKLRKQLLVLEDLKIGGKINTTDFENKLKNINTELKLLGIATRGTDLNKQFEEGKIGLRELNDELVKLKEAKLYVEIEKIQNAFDQGKSSREDFLSDLGHIQVQFVELSATAERNKLKEGFYNATVTLQELQDGMSRIAINENFKKDLIGLQNRLQQGWLKPDEFEKQSEQIRESIRKTSIEEERAAKKRSDREALAKAQLQYGAGSIGVAQEQRKQAQEQIKEQQKGLGENNIAKNFVSGIKEAAAAIPTLGESLQEVGKTAFKGLEDSLVSFVQTGKLSFEDLGKTISEMLIRIGIQKAIVAAIQLFATGAVFDSGKVTKFAQGGIVKSPTIFPMAKGQGLMGEKGPEGVLPLSRNQQGKLGVNAQGMGGNATVVNVYNQSSDSETKTEDKRNPDGTRQIDIYIVQKVKEALGNGGLDKSLEGAFGLRRQGQR